MFRPRYVEPVVIAFGLLFSRDASAVDQHAYFLQQVAAVAVNSQTRTLSRLVLSEAAVGVKVAGKITPIERLLLQPVYQSPDTHISNIGSVVLSNSQIFDRVGSLRSPHHEGIL